MPNAEHTIRQLRRAELKQVRLFLNENKAYEFWVFQVERRGLNYPCKVIQVGNIT